MLEFKTKDRPPPKTIQFKIDDRVIEFSNPGWAPIFLRDPNSSIPDQARLYLDWLGAGMADEDAQWIHDRLMDPFDKNFDLPEITDIFLGVIAEVTGRPIEPPSDSSPSRETADSMDGRHLKASTQN